MIKNANLKIAFDALYGTGRGYLDEILKRAGADVTVYPASEFTDHQVHEPYTSRSGKNI